MLEVIGELYNNGTLKILSECGIVSTSVLFWYEIAMEVDKQKKTTEKTTTEIVRDCSMLFGTSEMTIYRVIKKFKIQL